MSGQSVQFTDGSRSSLTTTYFTAETFFHQSYTLNETEQMSGTATRFMQKTTRSVPIS